MNLFTKRQWLSFTLEYRDVWLCQQSAGLRVLFVFLDVSGRQERKLFSVLHFPPGLAAASCQRQWADRNRGKRYYPVYQSYSDPESFAVALS